MSIAIIIVMASLSMAVFQAMKAHSDSAKCMANMRQLAFIILQYSAENNGELLPARVWNGERPAPGVPGPPSAKPWNAILNEKGYLPYSTYDNIPKSVMCCPARETIAGAAYNKMHYGMNWFPGFANECYQGEPFFKMLKVKSPSQTMLLGETKNFYMISYNQIDNFVDFPHRNKNNVIFMDGHAETSSPSWKMPKEGDSYPFY